MSMVTFICNFASSCWLKDGISELFLKVALELLKLEVKLLYLTCYFCESAIVICWWFRVWNCNIIKAIIIIPCFTNFFLRFLNILRLLSCWHLVSDSNLFDVSVKDRLYTSKSRLIWLVIKSLKFLLLLNLLSHFRCVTSTDYTSIHVTVGNHFILSNLCFISFGLIRFFRRILILFLPRSYSSWFLNNVFGLSLDSFKWFLKWLFAWLMLHCHCVINVLLAFLCFTYCCWCVQFIDGSLGQVVSSTYQTWMFFMLKCRLTFIFEYSHSASILGRIIFTYIWSLSLNENGTVAKYTFIPIWGFSYFCIMRLFIFFNFVDSICVLILLINLPLGDVFFTNYAYIAKQSVFLWNWLS